MLQTKIYNLFIQNIVIAIGFFYYWLTKDQEKMHNLFENKILYELHFYYKTLYVNQIIRVKYKDDIHSEFFVMFFIGRHER